MAEGRYSTLLKKIKKGYIGTGTGMAKLKAGYEWENGEYVKIWSGATLVSYYDGDTLLGTEEVDEGEDVLRPNIDTTKQGYTLVGWSTTGDESDIVTELTAQGDTMTLYAVYFANSITVVSNGTILNSRYASGSCAISQGIYWSNNTWYASFSLNKGKYQNGTIVANASFANAGTGNLNVGKASLDGVEFASCEGGGSGTRSISASNGSHSLALWLISYDNYTQNGSVSVTITLSNPKAWE